MEPVEKQALIREVHKPWVNLKICPLKVMTALANIETVSVMTPLTVKQPVN